VNRLRTATLAVLMIAWAAVAHAQLVVLAPTGESRDNLPVLVRHPAPSAVEATLTRGFSGRLLHLYALEQEFLRRKTGQRPEPAYLLLSNRQGGFPQFGFYLDAERKDGVGWVDLHRNSRLDGQFGAMDQIFPHELLHVIVRQLAGEPRKSGSNQMHAVGVRTDPVNAFNEGLAEHVQILAIDDSDAVASTKALARDIGARDRAYAEFEAYRDNLTRTIWPVQPARLRFLLWFSQSEQVQRYFAVKQNLFARQPAIPSNLLAYGDKYPAYLVQSVLAGNPNDPPKSAGVQLATDGPVAHLFWALMNDGRIQQRYLDEEFYVAFGTTRASVTPIDNAFLKLFFVLHEGKPSTTAETLQTWARVVPQDAADLAEIAREALLGHPLPDAPEIWLWNTNLTTGTSLFDQYRGLPRAHTFDANAATPLDWLAVPGVNAATAGRLIAMAPYANLQALLDSPEMPAGVRHEVTGMAAAMPLHQAASAEEESLSLSKILWPYLTRLISLVLVATVIGTWMARRVGVRRWWAAALIALTASLIVIAFSWIITCPGWYAVVAPIVIGGAPWAMWRLARGRGLRLAGTALLVWSVASFPAQMLVL
jgi:hypothetical protein